MDKNNRWVYESYNNCFTSDRQPDLTATLSDIYKRSEHEAHYYSEAILRATEKIAANEEERKQAAKAAAAKKKGKAGKNKDQKEEEEDKKEEKSVIIQKKDLDLFIPKEFGLAI
jgi:uncharacterized protein (DUF1501 family)